MRTKKFSLSTQNVKEAKLKQTAVMTVCLDLFAVVAGAVGDCCQGHREWGSSS